MARAARVSDQHRGTCSHGAPCCPHSVVGTIVGGSPTGRINGLQAARLGDSVNHSCPHCGTGHISSASGTVRVNGIPSARLDDSVTYPGGGGVITTASEDVSIGG